MLNNIEKKELQKTILVVDDTADNLSLILDLLKDKYKVKVANSGKKALSYFESSAAVDLILLDIMMPELSGYDVIKVLKKDEKTKDIPVIFLTAIRDMEDEQKGLEMGAADYITKPISASIMLARIKTQLENKEAKDFLRDKNLYLEDEVNKRTKEISVIQDVTILTLASLAETRDSDTGNHIRRTQHYMVILAKALQNHPRFRDYLSDGMIETLYRSAPLHDIGKVGIADKILLKPGMFTHEEFDMIKKHTTLGKGAIEHAEKELGMEVDFLKIAKEIAYSHHENYDGSGYPLGLVGDNIPISARLMAVADVYDALISKRIYKEAITHEEAVKIIEQGKGIKFDSDVVAVFLEHQNDFLNISQKYADDEFAIKQKQEQIDKIL
ncbi:MAG: response regulator [Sulfurimonas sp.]|uniref:HD domain-containing phosphohydrolase n=1 Tax=Sulfurimonas sp. TaxID=2022749 RepID=UPI0026267D37|nr:HD domain-containing phosphohydrolase [Sulfurimonas sp.]MDD5373707.1 response regulator [Sulfurimonas sp.]